MVGDDLVTSNDSYYVSWKESSDGSLKDDSGKRYHVSVINQDKYLTLSDSEKSMYKQHWAGSRFIELAGLTIA